MRSRLAAASLAIAAGAVACSGGPEAVGTTSAALTKVCGASPNDPVQGRDVSVYQGNFDWQAEKNAGVSFGYARVSDGLGYVDSQFSNNWQNMKSAGVLRGAYQFFRPGQDPTQQANMVVSKVGGALGDGDLPCMIDVEATDGQSPATIAANVKTWLDVVEKGTGRTPIIYTGAYFWQDYVQSTAFGGYPLWIANYGAVCPLVPDGWQSWLIWQYSDGGGALDHDVFNGSLSDLQALARPPNTPPRGWLDAADCTHAAGWAQDEDAPTQSIAVHVYFDGPPGSGRGVAVTADQHRQDLCGAIGSCEHGFTLGTPRSLFDGKPHSVRAYGIDTQGGPNPELAGSPKDVTCGPRFIPEGHVRRWVTSPASFAAWRFDEFMDVAPYADAALAAVPRGANAPEAPSLARSDDGAPEVWVIDALPARGGGVRVKRHVVDPASFAAWRFDWSAIGVLAASELAAMTRGPDWPNVPELVRGSGPEVDFLDVPPDTPYGPPRPSGADAGAATPFPPLPPGSGAAQGGASGGCGVGGAGGPGGGAWLAVAALASVARRRRLAR